MATSNKMITIFLCCGGAAIVYIICRSLYKWYQGEQINLTEDRMPLIASEQQYVNIPLDDQNSFVIRKDIMNQELAGQIRIIQLAYGIHTRIIECREELSDVTQGNEKLIAGIAKLEKIFVDGVENVINRSRPNSGNCAIKIT